jgi:hypothetical protein
MARTTGDLEMALVNDGIENDLLKANEEGILERLNPTMRRDVQRIVLAGMKVAIKNASTFVPALRLSKDPLRACAESAVNIAFLMMKSEGPNPPDHVQAAAAHASYILMLQAMDVAAKLGLIEVTEGTGGTIDKATRMATDRIFAAIHMTEQKMHTAASRVVQVTKNPEQMQAIRLKIGADRDPRAPQPTIPDEEVGNGPR